MWLQWFKRAWPYLVCFALGFGTSGAVRKEPEPVVVEKVVEKVVEAKREAVNVRRVTTTTTKPDGTKVVKQEDQRQTVKTERQTAETAKETASSPAPAKASYSAGVSYLPSLTAPPSSRDVRIEVGARLGQSDAWATGGYDVKNKQLSVGLRYEW